MTGFGVRGSVFLGDFRVVRPRHECTQEQGFDWLAKAHTKAAEQAAQQAARQAARQAAQQVDQGFDSAAFEKRMRQALVRFGCSDGQVARRGHELSDFLHDDWDRMEIFRLGEGAENANLDRRMAFFASRCDDVLTQLYPADYPSAAVPDLMIHVTCTGYCSPSPTQRLIALRGWQRQVQSTQAYHMGCYAAVPAMRMAAAGLASGMADSVDTVHNELCTLHFDPSAHEPEQLVVQSLFADGHIAYSLVARRERLQHGGCLRLLSVGEEIVPDTANQMTWNLAAGGFRMTLGRQVPPLIARSIGGFVARLAADAGLEASEVLSTCRAALHPGGPRIIDGLAEVLGLGEPALAASRGVLRDCGNMSSATLPHILGRMATDSETPAGTPILGLAFGPGLTMAGLLAIKE